MKNIPRSAILVSFTILGATSVAVTQPISTNPAGSEASALSKPSAKSVSTLKTQAKSGAARTASTVRSPQDETRRAQAVATFEGGQITVGDLEDELAQQSPLARERYRKPEQRTLLLEKLIRMEMLAREGESRGYAKDPDVIDTVKQNAVQTMIRERVDGQIPPESIPSEEVKKYYDEHIAEFVRPETRRANHIVVATREEAQQLIKELEKADLKEFRKAAHDRSLDQSTKMRAGDLGYFDKHGKSGSPQESQPPLDEALVKAAFTLAKSGDLVLKPVKIQGGYSVVKLTGQRPGLSRTLSEADPIIRKRLWRTKREEAMKVLVTQLRGQTPPEIHPELTDAIRLESGPPGENIEPGFPTNRPPNPLSGKPDKR